MKLILKQSVENLGEAGEVIKVKPGFGRNYLIPQGLAYTATQANKSRLSQRRGPNATSSKQVEELLSLKRFLLSPSMPVLEMMENCSGLLLALTSPIVSMSPAWILSLTGEQFY